MIYSCPKDFKNGKYFFNKYGVMDLLILVPGVIVGTLIAIASISMMSDESFRSEEHMSELQSHVRI